MEKENNKFKFTLFWSSSIFILLLMLVLGVNSSFKGTSAATEYCPSGTIDNDNGSCCKIGYQYAEGVCCPQGYGYYASGMGIFAKGCYKVQSETYNYISAADTCVHKETGEKVPACKRTDYLDTVEKELCDGYATENGECITFSLSKSSITIDVEESDTFTANSSITGTIKVETSGSSAVAVSPKSYPISPNYPVTITVTGVSVTSATTVIVTFTPTDTTKYKTVTQTVSVTVNVEEGTANLINPTIENVPKEMEVMGGENSPSTFEIKSNVKGTFGISSSDTTIATVIPVSHTVNSNETKKVTVYGWKDGVVIINLIFTPEDGSKYNVVTKTVKVTVNGASKCYYVPSSGNYVWSNTKIEGADPTEDSNCRKCYYISSSNEYEWSYTEIDGGDVVSDSNCNGNTPVLPIITYDRSITVNKGEASIFSTSSNVKGTFTFESDDPSIATVNLSNADVEADEVQNVTVKGIKAGKTTIKIKLKYKKNNDPNDDEYGEMIKSVQVTVTETTSGGNTSGGNTSGGNTSGGNTSGGNTSGGNTSGGNTSGGTGNNNTDSSGNVTDNVPTGDVVIGIIWFVGIFAIVYAAVNFRKIEEN